MNNTYEVVRPKSPPRLMLENSPLLTSLPKILQSTGTKKDSFFGGRNTSSIDNEYLMDYIVSNEEGEMSSLLNSNPQLRSIILNRKSMLSLIEQQNSIARNIAASASANTNTNLNSNYTNSNMNNQNLSNTNLNSNNNYNVN
jgi:hypothetical protein